MKQESIKAPKNNFEKHSVEINNLIIDYWNKNTPVQQIADVLNKLEFSTPTGLLWTKHSVGNHARRKLNVSVRKVRPIGSGKKVSDVVMQDNMPITMDVADSSKDVIGNVTISSNGIEKFERKQIDLNESDLKRNESEQLDLMKNDNLPSSPSSLHLTQPLYYESAKLNTSIGESGKNLHIGFLNPVDHINCKLVVTKTGEGVNVSLNENTEQIIPLEQIKEQKFITFNGVEIEVIQDENEKEFFSPRTICQILDINWENQRQRIKRDEALNNSLIKLKTLALDGKEREQLFLPTRKLSVFLYGISSSVVSEEIKPVLEKYKVQLEDILYNAFTKSAVILSPMEILHQSTGKLVELEKRQNAIDRNFTNILDKVTENEKILGIVKASIDIMVRAKENAVSRIQSLSDMENINFDIDYRKLINNHISSYLYATDVITVETPPEEKQEAYRKAWASLYNNFKFVKIEGKNTNVAKLAELETLATSKKVKPLDVLESQGLLKDFYQFIKQTLVAK